MEILKDFFKATGYAEDNKFTYTCDDKIYIKQGINDYNNHIVFALNYSDEPKTLKNIDCDAHEILSDKVLSSNESLSIEPWGVAILEY